MMRMTPLFAKALASATLLTGFAGSALAQTNFTFTTGYNPNSTGQGLLPTLNANGSSPAGEVNYNNFDNGTPGTASNPSISTTSAIYSTRNGRDIEEDSTIPNSPFRIVQGGFFVPAGQAVTLTSVTFDVYDSGATSNPFTSTSKGFFTIFANAPTTASGTPYSGNFTTNLLTTTPTFVGYRIPSGGSPTDTTRPIYQVTLDLTKLSNAKPLTSANGPYYFGVSVDASGPNDVNFPLANATDPNTGQPTTPGQGTSGDGIIYDSGNGYRPDAPAGAGVVDGFAMTFAGTIVSTAAPEPNSLLFVFGTLPFAAAGFVIRRRRSPQ